MDHVLSDDDAKRWIAANLRAAMELRGMSQAQLAAATGSTRMRISHYLAGARIPSAAVLARMAEALEVTADQLLSDPAKRGRKKIRQAV